MHQWSFAEYRRQIVVALPGRVGARVALAAPRGAAKSTLHSLLFPLMDLIAGRERHQVIISATVAQARSRLAQIKRELRQNGLLHESFFDGKAPRMKCSAQRIELGGCRIEVFGAGSEMRGISHGAFRPTRIILDDVEQGARAEREQHRRRLMRWYDEVVENLGDAYTHITVVGTILHSDSLLSRLLERPGYRGELYRSIMEWDRRPDLWREWRRLFVLRGGADDGAGEGGNESGEAVEGPARARKFFEENRREMLEGTRVLWPGKEPYEWLQERLLVAGRMAFYKEKQNSPIRDGSQLFDTAMWSRFRVTGNGIEVVNRGDVGLVSGGERLSDDRAGGVSVVAFGRDGAGPMAGIGRDDRAGAKGLAVSDLRYFGFLDPALGKSVTRDGDYAAIVTVGLAPDGALYVVHVWMERASPLTQVKQVFALHQKYRYVKFGFESNGFQETLGPLFTDVQRQVKAERGEWRLPVSRVDNRHSKHSRIAMMEPHILAGTILFDVDLPEEFYSQADEYRGNRSDHDDGLDALAACVDMTREMERPWQGVRWMTRKTLDW